jgi:adenylosuccinate synthase
MIPVNILDRLMVDINTAIVTHADAEKERTGQMYESIGSTTEGVGEAQARKVMRRHGASFIAMNVQELQHLLGSVSKELNDMVDRNEAILIEGTQGYGLSLNHGYYPYVTSRDVLAASMLSDSGLAPATVRNVIGVMRTYPIRVHGNSGPMGAEELTWDQVTKESGYDAFRKEKLEEKTTVTQRIRRVSRINWDMLQAAVRANRCTGLAITFLDYINANDRGKTSWNELTVASREFIRETERRLQTPIIFAGTGPNVADMIDLEGINTRP